MKKQITILLLLIIHWQLSGQGFVKKTDSPCNDKMADAVQGKWVKGQDLLSQLTMVFNKTQAQEVLNRLDAVHKLALEAYSNPIGADASWRRNLGYQPPFAFFYYDIAIHNYFCYGGSKNEIQLNDETGTGLTVYANDLLPLWDNLMEGDEWKIDGRPIKMRKTMIGKWKGYDLYSAGGPGMELSASRYVIMQRKGELPYVPVTRKQYLDRIIPYVTKFIDQGIKDYIAVKPIRTLEEQEKEKNKVLADYKTKYGSDPKKLKWAVDYYLAGYQTDQQEQDEQIKIAIKQKQDQLKKFNDELEKSTKEGLLESPAIIPPGSFFNPLVFSTEAEGGSMLVIENPKYMRKDLPKYVPQVFVLAWAWDPGPWALRFRKAFEENFPIEKLQAMIDK